MKRARTLLATTLCAAMLLSMAPAVIPASASDAAENKLEVIRVDPSKFDWAGEEAASIDFSKLSAADIPENGTLAGKGLTLLTSESTGSALASNIVEDGYMLLGKNARKNENPDAAAVVGAIYIKLDADLAAKAKQPYAVKVEYYGGNMAEDDAVNGGSYIDLLHNSLKSANTKTRKTYGTSWQNNAVSTVYYELPEANFNENIGGCKADFRLETWTGARLRIRSIAVIPYEPLDVPPMQEVYPGKTIASGDFGELVGTEVDKITDGVLTQELVKGNGLSLMTAPSKASNILKNGYLLLGKESRQQSDSAPVLGEAYLKLDAAVADKQNKAYAVKVDYHSKDGSGLDKGSYVSVNYVKQDGNTTYIKKTFGDTLGSDKVESFYYLLPNANFAEKYPSSSADFMLNTWYGAQLKIHGVSVVAYDPTVVTNEADAPALFTNNDAVASIDFGDIDAPAFDPYTDDILKGEIAFDGLSVLTNVDNGNSRASNRVTSDGYMLLGKAARINTLTGSGANQGRLYVRLDQDAALKKDKRYAVKVEYLDQLSKTVPDTKYGIASENNTINALSYLELHYSDGKGGNDKAKKLVFGEGNFNTNTIRTMYFLLPDAVFEGKVEDNGQRKGADFRLDTYGNGTQLKIKSLSVVEYDPEAITDDATQEEKEALFENHIDTVFVDVTKGERYGLEYPAGSNVFKIIDDNGEHFGVQSVEDLGLKITDPTVKAADKVTLTIKYWDIGTRSFSIQYNAVRPDGWEDLNPDSFYTYYSTPAFEMYNTKKLMTLKIPIENAAFEGKQNGGCDFRIHTQYIPEFYIEEISVKIGVEDVTLQEPVDFPPMTDTNNFKDRTVVGYQAWFQASDSQTEGWNHWNSGSAPSGGKQTFDIYPDVSDYPSSILHQTGYENLLNGQPAVLYDGTTEEAIDTQVKWMKDYGIDGFAVSRFFSGTSPVETPVRTKLDYMKEAAEKYDRLFYMGYDMSGIGGHGEAGIKRLESDFVLNVEKKFVTSPNYAQIDGKPVVSLWGFQGSQFNRYPNTENALALIQWFHDRGYYVIGGAPDNDWAKDQTDYKAVYEAIDMITPWTVGRYNDQNAEEYLEVKYAQDRAYIDAFNKAHPDTPKSYMPTIYPGFSWANWASGAPNAVPRMAGDFMWKQAKLASKYGFTSSFVAMFDEYDEGTSIAKMAEDSMSIPSDQYFVTGAADGKWLSSDFYLRLTGAISNMLRGELEATEKVPVPHATGPVFWRNGFERRFVQYKNSSNQVVTSLANIDVCIPNGEVLTNTGIDDIMNVDMFEDSYEEGFTTTGVYSFNLNGTAAPEDGKSQFYFKIADTDIQIQENMVLSYKLRAETELGGYVFVDLLLDNGHKLSDVQGGAIKAKRGTAGEWTPVSFALSPSLVGKTITGVIIAYDHNATGEFNAYVDDVIIQNADADRAALTDAVKDASALIDGKRADAYTADSVAALRTAIDFANGVLANEEAPASELTKAYLQVLNAMNGLVAVETETNPPADSSDGKKPGEETAPPTGDASRAPLFALLVTTSASLSCLARGGNKKKASSK